MPCLLKNSVVSPLSAVLEANMHFILCSTSLAVCFSIVPPLLVLSSNEYDLDLTDLRESECVKVDCKNSV